MAADVVVWIMRGGGLAHLGTGCVRAPRLVVTEENNALHLLTTLIQTSFRGIPQDREGEPCSLPRSYLVQLAQLLFGDLPKPLPAPKRGTTTIFTT